MAINLKDKAADISADTLKSVNDGGKLKASNDESSQKLVRQSVDAAEDVAGAVKDGVRKNHNQKLTSSNQEIANQMLLHANEESGDKLYTAGNRRKHMEALRNGEISESVAAPNSDKLHDNRKKLQKKLQQEYRVKTQLKGGLKNDLVIEQTAESKLYDTSKYGGVEAAGNFGKRVMHFANDMADDKNGTGIQNAWTDTASKTADTAYKVYSLSQTARYWRADKQEKEIAKLARQQDKIAMNNIKFDYHYRLKSTKESELWKNSNLYEKHLQKKAIKRKYMKNAVKEYQKAKKSGAAGKVAFDTGFSAFGKLKNGMGSIASHIGKAVGTLLKSPVGKIVIVAVLVLAIMVGLIGVGGSIMMLAFGGDSDFSTPKTGGSFPAEVLQWSAFVTERCEANNDASSGVDLTQFVNAILAIIQQESGGVSSSCGGDLMQCKACGLWDTSKMPSDWTTEQQSIDTGIRYFYQGLKQWNVTSADDYDGLQMVAQGYNYGFAFLNWAKTNNYTKWSLSISTQYSNKMCSSLGYSSYGHKEYGEEWLEKYMAGGSGGSGDVVEETGAGGVVKTAQNQIGITENPAGSNNVIFNTDYYGHEVSGDSYPWCCAFVWWCFNKSGNASAFYGGGKTASCAAVYSWAQSNGLFINASEARYGDIVLFGNNEHIEIVVSKNSDGSYTTIGGNTSSDTAGSQSNGGCVALKTRYTTGGFPITSFIRPVYSSN